MFDSAVCIVYECLPLSFGRKRAFDVVHPFRPLLCLQLRFCARLSLRGFPSGRMSRASMGTDQNSSECSLCLTNLQYASLTGNAKPDEEISLCLAPGELLAPYSSLQHSQSVTSEPGTIFLLPFSRSRGR